MLPVRSEPSVSPTEAYQGHEHLPEAGRGGGGPGRAETEVSLEDAEQDQGYLPEAGEEEGEGVSAPAHGLREARERGQSARVSGVLPGGVSQVIGGRPLKGALRPSR